MLTLNEFDSCWKLRAEACNYRGIPPKYSYSVQWSRRCSSDLHREVQRKFYNESQFRWRTKPNNLTNQTIVWDSRPLERKNVHNWVVLSVKLPTLNVYRLVSK